MARGLLGSIAVWLFLTVSAFGQDRIEISLENNTQKEIQTKRRLEGLLDRYKLSKWIFTKRVHINEQERIPHSHPILTLNTRYFDDDLRLMSVFVHEQIHWHEEKYAAQRDQAIAELQVVFPTVPVRAPEAARDKNSTYLHLIVCYLEYEAMNELAGPEKAREIMSGWQHYTWVYRTVLTEGPKIRAVLGKWRLLI